jgi:hypothetical protein
MTDAKDDWDGKEVERRFCSVAEMYVWSIDL